MRDYFALRQLWLWKKSNIRIWSETILVTVVVLLICYWVNRQNPLFLHSIFPWPWIAPVIIVLRYGFGPGLLSALIVSATAIFLGPHNALLSADHQTYILSGLLLTFLCALFSTSVVRRMNNAEELLRYSQERLHNLSRSYYVLHASYNYLEQNLIMQPISLRSVLVKLQELLIEQQGKLNTTIAQRFLELVCQYCHVNQAGIYLVSHHKADSKPLAEVGLMGTLNSNDPLVTAGLKSTEMCYISLTQLEDLQSTQYLVVAPMRNGNDELLAILIIKEMSFKTLTIETLRILSILINYFMAEASVANTMADFFSAYPHCPPQFAQELNKLLLLKKRLNIDSGLVAIAVAKELRPHNVIYSLQQQQRVLDCAWVSEHGNFDVLISLLPLTDDAGIQGYLQHLAEYLKTHLDLNIDQKVIKSRFLQLSPDSAKGMMQKFLTYSLPPSPPVGEGAKGG